MKRQLNKNEFLRVRRWFEDAKELAEAKEMASALSELKKAIRLLERDSIQTRMLAACKILEGKILQAQNKPAQACFENALVILEQIGDSSSLKEECRQLLKQESGRRAS